jgi:hypothetical protein
MCCSAHRALVLRTQARPQAFEGSIGVQIGPLAVILRYAFLLVLRGALASSKGMPAKFCRRIPGAAAEAHTERGRCRPHLGIDACEHAAASATGQEK